MLVSAVTGSERTLAPGVDVVLEVVTREAVRILDEVAAAVVAARGEAAMDDETARGVVPLVTVPLSARPRLHARTAARSLW